MSKLDATIATLLLIACGLIFLAIGAAYEGGW